MCDYRIIVAGSRDFCNYDLLEKKLLEFIETLNDASSVEIISGHARGADRLGEMFAVKHSLPYVTFPADWSKYGKSAGYVRNYEMGKYAAEHKGVLFAFWDGKSKGTYNMVTTSKRLGIDTHLCITEYNTDSE